MAWEDVRSKPEVFAYIFNRTVLGVGVLLIARMAVQEYWLRVGIGLFLVGVYF